MITVKVNTAGALKHLNKSENDVKRAAEISIDKAAMDVRAELVQEMRSVFDRPTAYTLNSLKVTKTKNHNMLASVAFKTPERMDEHYLTPQVEGGRRKLKGFERGIDDKELVPGSALKLNTSGNITANMAKKILASLKSSGSSTSHDYVYLKAGSKGKKLPPGVYQRYAYRGTGLNAATRKSLGVLGTHQKGVTLGKISSIVRARGLRPVLIVGQRAPVKPLLKFYEVGGRVAVESFNKHFNAAMSRVSL